MCLCGILLWPIAILRAAPLDPAATRELLGKIAAERQRNPSLRSDFSEEKRGGILARPALAKGKIWFTAPDRFRREISQPGQESLIVSDGKVLWMVYPAFQEAERYDLAKQKILNQALAAFTTGLAFHEVERDFTVAAETTAQGHTLTLVPRRSAIARLVTKIELEFSQKLELRRILTLAPKGEITRIELQNTVLEPHPADTFQYVPPPGYTVSNPLGK